MPHRSDAIRLLDLAGSEAVLETLPLAVSLIDAPTRRIVYRNAESRRIAERVNLPYDDVDLAAHMGFLRPDGTPLPAGEIPGVASLERGESVREMPLILRCLDGTRLDLLLDSAPLRDEDGAIAGAIVTFREALPMKADARRLEESESLLAASARGRNFHALLDAATRDLGDAAAVADVTTHMVGVHLKVSRCVYGTIDPERDEVHIFPGFVDGVPNESGTFPLAAFGAGFIVRQKAGMVDAVGDTATDPRTRDAYESTFEPQETRALIAAPLVKGGRLVAFFAVQHREARVWTDEEIRFVGEVAERTWGVLERIAEHRNLEASEAMHRTLVEGLPQLVWTGLPNGERDYHSPQWLAYTGRLSKESVGWRWLEAIHPEDRAAISEGWEERTRLGLPFEAKIRIRGATGGYRWFHARARPVRDSDGKVVKWMGATTDIEEQDREARAVAVRGERQRRVADAAYRITHAKTVEAILRLATEEMRAVFGARAVLVRLRNDRGGLANWAGSLADGRFLWATVGAMPSIERLVERSETGYGALHIDLADNALVEKLRSLGMDDLLTRESDPPMIAPLLAKDGDHLGAVMVIGPPNDKAWVEDGPTLVQFAQLVAAAIENERLTAGLEAKVAERTAQLLQKVEELEGFSYMVSHDLRAPLRSIVGNARMVLMDEGERVSPGGKAMLERLARAAVTMSDLVDDLLEYARLGAKEPRREPVAIALLAERVAAEVRADYPSATIRVSVPPETFVECDPQLIGLVLRNLMDNACKYVAPGAHPDVELALDGDGFVLRDRGIGFDMTYADKLFKPFSRLHTNKAYAGTGIGLANVRRILERHGGRIGVESEPGQGTAFRFTLDGGCEEAPRACA